MDGVCGAEDVFFSLFSHRAGSHLPDLETHRREREVLRCRGGETRPVAQPITRELQGPSVIPLVQGHASSNPSQAFAPISQPNLQAGPMLDEQEVHSRSSLAWLPGLPRVHPGTW